MGKRKSGYSYRLDCGDITSLSNDEIATILRAADPIIASGGRTLLAKILKGSKDKAVLAHNLNDNPSYGVFADKSIKLIMNMIDRCIMDDFFRIDREGRMPVLLYTRKGWEIEREIFAEELLDAIQNGAASGNNGFIERMLTVNPECVLLALDQIDDTDNPNLRKALAAWLPQAKGKVKKKLNSLLA